MIYRESAKPAIIVHKHSWLFKIKRFFQRILVRINIWSNDIPIWPFTPFRFRVKRYATGKTVQKQSPQRIKKVANWPHRPRPWSDPTPNLPPIPKTRVIPIKENEEIFQINYENEMPEDWKQYMNSKGLDAGYIMHRNYETLNGLKVLNKGLWDIHRNEWKYKKYLKLTNQK